MKDLKISLSQNTRSFLFPLGAFLLLSVLFFLCLKQGFAKVSEINRKISDVEKKVAILTQKENLLYQLTTGVSSQTNLASVVLPNYNPALLVINQIRNQALINGLMVENIKVGAMGKEKGDIFRVEISFETEGPLVSLISLAKALKQIAPLSAIEAIDLKIGGQIALAKIKIKSYWSDFPVKMPSVSDQVADLTEAENELLGNLAKLTLPSFSSLIPVLPAQRDNPF